MFISLIHTLARALLINDDDDELRMNYHLLINDDDGEELVPADR